MEWILVHTLTTKTTKTVRHRVRTKKVGKSASHRKAMLSNMASSLIEHKRIRTTHQKAIALKRFIEPMITKAKDGTLHNRRQVLKRLNNQTAVKTLFDVIGPIGFGSAFYAICRYRCVQSIHMMSKCDICDGWLPKDIYED